MSNCSNSRVYSFVFCIFSQTQCVDSVIDGMSFSVWMTKKLVETVVNQHFTDECQRTHIFNPTQAINKWKCTNRINAHLFVVDVDAIIVAMKLPSKQTIDGGHFFQTTQSDESTCRFMIVWLCLLHPIAVCFFLSRINVCVILLFFWSFNQQSIGHPVCK